MRHLKRKQEPCGPCRSVFEEAQPGWNSKPRQPRPIKHGTTAGARAHQSRHEAVCGPCARAYRAYQNERRAAKKTASAAA
jgi:hypothetical protein